MEINIIKSNGYFTNSNCLINNVMQNGNKITYVTNAKDIKDPITYIIDLSSATLSSVVLTIKGVDGGKDVDINLQPQKYNLGSFTTNGFKNSNGELTFELWSYDGNIEMSQGIKILLYTNTPVVNH